MTDKQAAPGTPILWCRLCGQRHASSGLCDPNRLKQLAEWRSQLAAHRQASQAGRMSNAPPPGVTTAAGQAAHARRPRAEAEITSRPQPSRVSALAETPMRHGRVASADDKSAATRAPTARVLPFPRPKPAVSDSMASFDPLIEELLGHLPKAGKPFSADRRHVWLQCAAAVCHIIHGAEGESEHQGADL